MADTSYQNNDEIDLSELIAIIWSHKIWVGLVTVLSIFICGYYAINVQKYYTARAIFEVEQNNRSSGLNLNNELGALASLAGLSGTTGSSTEVLLERVMQREFILEASEGLLLRNDPFFQTYKAEAKEPLWKAQIKKLIGWEKSTQDVELIIEETIQKNFRNNIRAEATNAGAIVISVTHIDPNVAANYANQIMEQIRQTVTKEDEKSKKLRLSYLAETLADALQDMETAQGNIKNYTLENSAAAQENFIVGSLQLDSLRIERREAGEFLSVLGKLKNLVELGELDMAAYNSLRVESPLVDDVDFRRVLGMSETISAWSWPSLETIESVTETLSDREKRLDVEIANIEQSAVAYAASAEDQAKLLRDVKIAEATFTVLTEQVKSQTLVAGFKPDTFKVFAYASPPLLPSSPKRNLILAIGAVFGLFLGSITAVANGVRRGVFYTRYSLISRTQSASALRSNSLKRLARLSGEKLLKALDKSPPVELEEAIATLSNKKLIYVTNNGGSPSASQMSRLLAAQSFRSGRKTLLFNTSIKFGKIDDTNIKKDIDRIKIAKADEGFDEVQEENGSIFANSSTFEQQIKSLMSSYEQVFICSDNQKSIVKLIALKPFNPELVMLSRLRKTKKKIIDKIISLHPISIIFHD